jgi:hypothetical protein
VKQGKALETLVECLERALAKSDAVTITAPKKLRDKVTKRLREHDVVLTINQGHHESLIAIECRDRSRPITVNDIEGFWTKCQHTDVSGIIVSTKGFYKSARLKASHLGIRCFDLEQAKSLNWFLAQGLETIAREILHIQWTLVPAEELDILPVEFTIYDKDGIEITSAILNVNARREFEQVPYDTLGEGLQHVVIRFDCKQIYTQDKLTGNKVPLKELRAEIEYNVHRGYAPFDFLSYLDKVNGNTITDAAIAQIELADVKGKLMFIGKAESGINLTFIPDEKQP